MGTINRETRITCGAFWLSPPGERAKYPYWRIMWYDRADEQTRCTAARRVDDAGADIQGREGLIRTLSDEDEQAARTALVRYAEAHPEIVKREAPADEAGALLRAAVELTPETLEQVAEQVAALKAASPPKKLVAQADLPVVTCLTHYSIARLQRVRGLERVLESKDPRKKKRKKVRRTVLRDALRNVMQIWGNPMVSELDSEMQDRFIATLRAQGISDWTILTRLKCIWAAVRYMVRKKFLLASAVPMRTPANLWDPPAALGSRNVKLPIDDLARLFDEAWYTPHCWRYMVKETGEAARPFAPCETTPDNVDWEVGNIDLLEIEMQGVQSHKRKAIIRCCPTLLAHLKVWAAEEKPPEHDPHFITYQGRALASMHFFRELAKRAKVKIPRKAGAYILRHTWATWAARCGAPEIQRKFVMGQAVAEGSHGFYTHFEPEYCMEAVDATELLYHVIAARMKNRAAARALLILGTEPLDVLPSREAAKACAAASRARAVKPVLIEVDQPEAGGMTQAWPLLAARGLWVMRSPFALRGNSSDLDALNQGLSGEYIDPDKMSPTE